MTQIDPFVEGKKVLLLGFGREGQSTYQMLARTKAYKELAVADRLAARPQHLDPEVAWSSGPDYQAVMEDYDLVFKSPGIVLDRPVTDYRCRIVSQSQLFFSLFRDQIIGITGTKGKSTTTSLLYHILRSAGRKVLLAGNIGIPAFDQIDRIDADTDIVFELSCHQLEHMTVSPHIALLLNIHEEHLDHYGTMDKYVRSKQNIYRYQRTEDILVCGERCLPPEGTCPSALIPVVDLGETPSPVKDTASRTAGLPPSGRLADPADCLADPSDCIAGPADRPASPSAVLLRGSKIFWKGGSYQIPAERLHLLGHHNHYDIAFVYQVCKLKGIDDETFTRSLESYEPLPHRLSFLGEKDGIRYYDDSISTIGDTTIQALNTLKDTDTVLIGGMDRGIDYRDLIRYLSLSPIPHIILMEATGKRIYEEILQDFPVLAASGRLILVGHLEEAVQKAKALTRPGHSCVLSPAAASYGIFKNFEERGDVFKRLTLGS